MHVIAENWKLKVGIGNLSGYWKLELENEIGNGIENYKLEWDIKNGKLNWLSELETEIK